MKKMSNDKWLPIIDNLYKSIKVLQKHKKGIVQRYGILHFFSAILKNHETYKRSNIKWFFCYKLQFRLTIKYAQYNFYKIY